jgi:hypothetical protein
MDLNGIVIPEDVIPDYGPDSSGPLTQYLDKVQLEDGAEPTEVCATGNFPGKTSSFVSHGTQPPAAESKRPARATASGDDYKG